MEMERNIATTPFGRRPMSLALVATQAETRDLSECPAVNKWRVYRDLCEGKGVIGVGDRALAVLNGLLSFYPDTELSEENGLIVFPSNAQLSLRAHGMADATLRRHLAALVNCGLIIRRDSPNGKRYARKDAAGELEDAFGFSLAPLVARAEEFQAAAEHVRADARALKLVRERITLHRRDIQKLIEAAVEEKVPGAWSELWMQFRAIVERIPRRATAAELGGVVADLAALRDKIANVLESHVESTNMSGNESQTERQHSNSNTNTSFEFELAFEKSRPTADPSNGNAETLKTYPLGLVLRACPDIIDYAADGISSWRELMTTAAQVRGYLGISPSAYVEALEVLGQENGAIVIALILQRAQFIHSAGGYLRALTDKARQGQFSIGPMLMAALRTNGVTGKKTG
jgi:replication initiation protein RepC